MNKKTSSSVRAQIDKKRKRSQWLLIALSIVLVSAGIILLTPLRSTVAFHFNNLRTRVIYAFNPPDEAVFVPEEQQSLETIVAATLLAFTPSPTTEVLPSATPESTGTPAPSMTPTVTATPIPQSVDLPGVVYVHQHNRWNYCGPANLTMALKFWGWEGDRDDVARAIKPGENDPDKSFIDKGKSDKNVMPYEMANFVADNTDYAILTRYGGDIDVLKNLLANGYPVLIEKGYYERDYTGKITWMGHYLFVTGYDENEGVFIVQDAYLEPGENLRVPYQEFIDGWRGFNYLFMVISPTQNQQEVLYLLGPWADETWANQNALNIANSEINNQSGIDEFFAWFNKGTSHVQLFEYVDAAFAYDYAFLLYANLGDSGAAETVETQRPYRMMWYQTGPYFAYYYSGRYQDVIELANTTLYDTIADPTLEESIYWRGMAKLALGETDSAIADFRETVYLNSNFIPGLQKLNELGVSP